MFLCAFLAAYTQTSVTQFAIVNSFAGCGPQVTPHPWVLGFCSKVGSLDACEIKATHRAKALFIAVMSGDAK